jgi:hypothetical protein
MRVKRRLPDDLRKPRPNAIPSGLPDVRTLGFSFLAMVVTLRRCGRATEYLVR